MERPDQGSQAQVVEPHPDAAIRKAKRIGVEELKESLKFRNERVSIINADPSSS